MQAINFVVRTGAGAVERGQVAVDAIVTKVAVPQGSEISLNLRQIDIQSYARVGDSLEVLLVDGRVVLLEQYYAGAQPAARLFISADGFLNEVVLVDAGADTLMAQYGPTEQWGKWSPSDALIFAQDSPVVIAPYGENENEVSMLGAGLLAAGGGVGVMGGGAAALGSAALIGGVVDPTGPTIAMMHYPYQTAVTLCPGARAASIFALSPCLCRRLAPISCHRTTKGPEMTEICCLCGATATAHFALAPRADTVALCPICHAGATGPLQDGPHWQCLNDAIWAPEPATQVLAFRLLSGLGAHWAQELLDIAYLEEDTRAWAEAGLASPGDVVHRDSNGAVLAQGDTVHLIKDLVVKGAGFTAKRGTAVRNISLVPDNRGQIEGRVEGQRIVILTEFVKKSA